MEAREICSWISEKGFRRSAKRLNTRKNYGSEVNSIARKGSRGKFHLAGCRGGAPAGAWGNAPIVSRATSMPNALNKGAGSEASLPVTSRSRRSAPKLLFPSTQHCRAKWARPTSMGEGFLSMLVFFIAGEKRRAYPTAIEKPRQPLDNRP